MLAELNVPEEQRNRLVEEASNITLYNKWDTLNGNRGVQLREGQGDHAVEIFIKGKVENDTSPPGTRTGIPETGERHRDFTRFPGADKASGKTAHAVSATPARDQSLSLPMQFPISMVALARYFDLGGAIRGFFSQPSKSSKNSSEMPQRTEFLGFNHWKFSSHDLSHEITVRCGKHEPSTRSGRQVEIGRAHV